MNNNAKTIQQLRMENQKMRELLEKAMSTLKVCSSEMERSLNHNEMVTSMLMISTEVYQNTLIRLTKNGEASIDHVSTAIDISLVENIKKFQEKTLITSLDKNDVISSVKEQCHKVKTQIKTSLGEFR